MPRAIRIHEHGGPEVLRLETIDPEPLGHGRVRIRQGAIGVNFIDTYNRTGLYPAKLPGGLGREAAGIVIEAGKGVRNLREGDRVAYVSDSTGAYVDERVMDAARVVKLPDSVSDREAAALMLKGLTAWMLLRRCHAVRRGEWILLHAAAGGVGLIALQWAVALGAKVIAVVGSDEKAALVREHRAAEVIVSSGADIAARVRAITGGRGVPVVYDGVGKDTFFASLDSLGRFGLMVSYGNASGVVTPFSPLELSRRGSLFLTRPTLFHYIEKPSALARAARELFDLVGSGHVKARIGQTYGLAEAAQAHRDLEARRTTGSTILIP